MARPDVVCVVARAARAQTRNPDEAIKLVKGCWKLVCKTKTLGMSMEPSEDESNIEISADVSFGSGVE
eukprot:7395701-Prorocentrum_lima.AAC.1